MEKTKRNRKVNRRKKESGGFFRKLFSNVGNPEAIENQEWYLDSPDARLTRIFSVVLVLHLIAVGGIVTFKVVEKGSVPGGLVLNQVVEKLEESPVYETELAGEMPKDPIDVEVPPIPGESTPERYRVGEGDTLSEIASKLDVSEMALRVANRISSPDDITPGTWLDVPLPDSISLGEVRDYDSFPDHPTTVNAGEMDQMKSSLPEDSPDWKKSRGVVYQVQKGDTAWGISQKFGITHQALLEFNQIARPEELQAGQIIDIPVQ